MKKGTLVFYRDTNMSWLTVMQYVYISMLYVINIDTTTYFVQRNVHFIIVVNVMNNCKLRLALSHIKAKQPV